MDWKKDNMPPIVVESSGFEGVRRIAGKVAEDIRSVVGELPEVVTQETLSDDAESVILCATAGHSLLLEKLRDSGKVDISGLYRTPEEAGAAPVPKREVYLVKSLTGELCGRTRTILLICGSDKRGTIYGMFSLSEYIGVSPLCYWGDVKPAHRESIHIEEGFETLSKEPSVKYRGFFINDEWPCFGTWVNRSFGGFNAQAYDRIFELLLRMKGNYLWPAMWTAAFPLDGPGSANEELADLYGVVMGYSHHEPCLRASEEWKKVCGPDSRYGNEWNYYTNEQGLTNYWEDSLKRSGGYENMITIGMRGEYDSSMLGPDATVEENVDLLKRIITRQKELIRRHVERDGREIPLMLALYKEVEAYFYGDERTPGLKDWEGLSDVICMLCEDNYGQMRTLPTEDIRGRSGGFGMYYHFDYHGAPVSYEWVDSTPLSKVWEQMCQAYEYGIRDVWIVNVGDLKFHELPLTYFMALAYDYDKWGYGNKDSYTEYTELMVRRDFAGIPQDLQKKIGEVFTDYIAVNALRRPEALHPGVYHPCHYNETDRMLSAAEKIEDLSCSVADALRGLDGTDDRLSNAYYSMIHYPAMASMNLLKMHLYAGKNHHYAGQGRTAANVYGGLTADRIRRDRELADEWAAFLDGKWDGMQLAQHIGFTKWNEDDYRYPLMITVEPAHCARMSVSRKDSEKTAVKNYGAPMVIEVPEFADAGHDEVRLEIANGGTGSLHYKITAADADAGIPDWLIVEPVEKDVEQLEKVTLRCVREKLPPQLQTVRLMISDGDTAVAVDVKGRAAVTGGLPEHTYHAENGVIVINADHYCDKKDAAGGSYTLIKGYGKYGAGVKVLPSTADFGESEDKPEISYRFYLEEAGDYQVDLITSPFNSVVNRRSVSVMVNGRRTELLPADFKAGDYNDPCWAAGVLDQERRRSVVLPFDKGVQTLTIGAMEAGAVLERVQIHKPSVVIPEAYLGPEESRTF